MTNQSTDDFTSRLQGLWLPLITPFRDGELDEASLRRLVRHYAAGPVDGFILAATSGEGMSLRADELERLVTVTRSELAGSGRRLPILPRPVRRLHRPAAGCAGRDGDLADRRLSDREPLLPAALAAWPGAAFHRARRPRLVADRALQHPLPHRRQPHQRDAAAACLASEHRRHEGLRRRPRAVDRLPSAEGRPAFAC